MWMKLIHLNTMFINNHHSYMFAMPRVISILTTAFVYCHNNKAMSKYLFLLIKVSSQFKQKWPFVKPIYNIVTRWRPSPWLMPSMTLFPAQYPAIITHCYTGITHGCIYIHSWFSDRQLQAHARYCYMWLACDNICFKSMAANTTYLSIDYSKISVWSIECPC